MSLFAILFMYDIATRLEKQTIAGNLFFPHSPYIVYTTMSYELMFICNDVNIKTSIYTYIPTQTHMENVRVKKKLRLYIRFF